MKCGSFCLYFFLKHIGQVLKTIQYFRINWTMHKLKLRTWLKLMINSKPQKYSKHRGLYLGDLKYFRHFRCGLYLGHLKYYRHFRCRSSWIQFSPSVSIFTWLNNNQRMEMFNEAPAVISYIQMCTFHKCNHEIHQT